MEFDGIMSGIRIRLQETEGRSGKLTICCPLAVMSAARVDFNGNYLRAIETIGEEADRVEIEFINREYFEIALTWKT